MSYTEPLAGLPIAISISESADMGALGLSEAHLRDAMGEVARHFLALVARLVYGGDLRMHGFTELLLELVARHRRDVTAHDDRAVENFLAWPVHITQELSELEQIVTEVSPTADIRLLQLDGTKLAYSQRRTMAPRQPTANEWNAGLTNMRRTMLANSVARVSMGGRVEKFNGVMPGIAEEALLSLMGDQPLFLLGGFGGATRDIAETIGLPPPRAGSRGQWIGRDMFQGFSVESLRNGLDAGENALLARTSHIDQAIALVLRGLTRVFGTGHPKRA